MDDFLKMDIFFLAATALVVVLAVGAGLVTYYVVRILRHVEHLTENVSTESDRLRRDIEVLRAQTQVEGLRVRNILSFIRTVFRSKQGE